VYIVQQNAYKPYTQNTSILLAQLWTELSWKTLNCVHLLRTISYKITKLSKHASQIINSPFSRRPSTPRFQFRYSPPSQNDVSSCEVLRTIRALTPKSSLLDFIPTSLAGGKQDHLLISGCGVPAP